jgi:SAM-dependent methyltransferase
MPVRVFSIRPYVLSDFSFSNFPSTKRVVDIGCGAGCHLRELVAHGCEASGVGPDPTCVADLRAEGFEVIEGKAEKLPFSPGSLDGVVCSVTVPYTDERAAIAEWFRILVPGGEVRVSNHGFGYPIRQLVVGPGLKRRFYGLRTVLNTWFYRLTGCRLPGWLGDTLYQSRRQLNRYYHQLGFGALAAPPAKEFWGLPVFIYHRLQKSQEDRDNVAARDAELREHSESCPMAMNAGVHNT